MIGSLGLDGQSRDQMRPTNDELGWLNREAHKQKRAAAFSNSPWFGRVCGLRGARFENRNQTRELGISNPEFVDGTVHVGGAERHILEAPLERVVVTNRRPVDAQS
jgi:hypothetical protein